MANLVVMRYVGQKLLSFRVLLRFEAVEAMVGRAFALGNKKMTILWEFEITFH